MTEPAPVAIVTGGAAGIGLAAVEALAADGMHVVAMDLPSASFGDVERIAQSAAYAGVPAPGDVTSADDWAVVVRCVGSASAVSMCCSTTPASAGRQFARRLPRRVVRRRHGGERPRRLSRHEARGGRDARAGERLDHQQRIDLGYARERSHERLRTCSSRSSTTTPMSSTR